MEWTSFLEGTRFIRKQTGKLFSFENWPKIYEVCSPEGFLKKTNLSSSNVHCKIMNTCISCCVITHRSDDTATKSDGIFERHWVDRQGSVDSKAGMKLPCKCSNEKPHFSLTKELDGNQSVTNKSTKQEKNKKHGQKYIRLRIIFDRVLFHSDWKGRQAT